MKLHYIFPLVCAFLLAGCSNQKTDSVKAAGLVEESRQLADSGHLNEAKIRLDSVHHTYPKCVAQRRLAKDLQDSIAYIEAKRTLAYSDSLLQVLQPQADPLLKKFNYEKQEQYEDNGRYVHKLLTTDRNTDRCYLQVYVTDAYETAVKSYYAGKTTLYQTALELQANEDIARFEGSEHHFDLEHTLPHRSIHTFSSERSLELLNFVSSHMQDRIRVNLLGRTADDTETNYVYYLSDTEKTALQDTYQLGFVMGDIKRLEDAIRLSGLQIGKYEKKHSML